MNKEELKEKIIEILEEVDNIHTDGYLLREHQEKLADQIFGLFKKEKQDLLKKIEEAQKEQTKVEWGKHISFLYRHRKQAKVAGEPVYLAAMEEEIKNCENWYKNIFGKKP